jgi:hypothetical protein
MSYLSGTILAPVSIYDVQQALGVSERDLGSLCIHENVNPWAKYKPVRFPAIDTTKDPTTAASWLNNDKTWASVARWWNNPTGQSSDMHSCGFHIPTKDVASLVSADFDGWEYEKPRGGANEPFRLLDFNQYFHNAVVPFYVDIPSQIVVHNGDTRGLVKTFLRDHPTIDPLGLAFSDIFGTSVKLGVAVINGSNIRTKTQATVSDASISLEGLTSILSVGDTAKIIAFATTQTKSSWTVDDYIAYGLSAPGITFATSAEIPVVNTLNNVYQLAVTGISGVDRTCLMPGAATLSTAFTPGRVIANNRSTKNPTYTWDCVLVTCTVEIVNRDGTSSVYEIRQYSPTGVSPNISVFPEEIAHNDGPYSQIYCDNAYGFLPSVPDPTQQYVRCTYTLHYERA